MAKKKSKPTIDELEKILEPDAEKRIAELRERIERDAVLIKNLDGQIVKLAGLHEESLKAPPREVISPDAARIGTTFRISGNEIVESIRKRHAANGVSPVGFNETPPSTFHEALERAKAGELRRWYGPQFQIGAAEHTLSEVVQISKRLDVIENFLEHLIRSSG